MLFLSCVTCGVEIWTLLVKELATTRRSGSGDEILTQMLQTALQNKIRNEEINSIGSEELINNFTESNQLQPYDRMRRMENEGLAQKQ